MPLDLGQLMADRRAQEAESKRPKFLTAAQRAEREAALAFQQRAAQVESKKRAHSSSYNDTLTAKEGIRPSASALRVAEAPKKKRRTNDPKKFTFDWDAADDTSADLQEFAVASSVVKGSRNAITDRHKPQAFNRSRDSSDRQHADNERSSVNSYDDRHWSEKPLAQMRERDWRIFKEDFSIQTKGGSVPSPIRNWDEANLSEDIMAVIRQVGYNEPTPIQKAAIPIGLKARDIIGIAETGSGKTASFVLPMLAYIQSLPSLDETIKNNGPFAIVLAPTRELAQQIESETRKFASALGFVVVSIVGGHSIEEQSFNLRNGAEIVIATPGRLLDCLERHVLVLSQCTYIVMDEADRMVDLGFEEAVNAVLDALPVHNMKPDTDDAERPEKMSALIGGRERFRQTVMFSATMAPAVEKLARKYLRRPATVIIGNAGQVVDTVEQRVEVINGDDKKRRRLEAILSGGEFNAPIIIFVNTKRYCDILSKHVGMIGWNAVTLHGGKTQEQREASLTRLRSGAADILVATDLAGRGIDVPDVSLVVNFNMAKTIEDYVHRIGRTGRAGRKGTAITFIQDEEEELFYPLKLLLKSAQNVPVQIRTATKLLNSKGQLPLVDQQ